MNPQRSETNVALVVLCLVSIQVAYVIYQDGPGISGQCSPSDIVTFMQSILYPGAWFGFFAAILAAFGAWWVIRSALSRWAVLDDYKWLILGVLAFSVFLFTSVYCNG